MMKWYDSYPYTQESLMNKMNDLLGKGNYTIAIVPDEMKMICLLGLKKKAMGDEFKKLLEEIVPLNITMDIGIRYNKWKTMNKYTWSEMHKYTWEGLRSGTELEEMP